MQYDLKKIEILRGKNLFSNIFKEGGQLQGKYLKCYVVKCAAEPGNYEIFVHVGFVIPRVVKLAVDRNRIKRYMRESYRLNKTSLINYSQKFSLNIKLIFLFPFRPHRSVKIPKFSDLENDMKSLINSIVTKEITGSEC